MSNLGLKNLSALIYMRLSSKKQEDGMSKEVQEDTCRKFCKKEGLVLKNIYYENKSAMQPDKRPVFQEIIDCQKTKNRVDVIVVFSLNRLTRNQPDFYKIRELVDEYNTIVVLVKENLVIKKPFKSHEKFLLNLLVANAEFEVEYMNEIRKNGLIARAKTGKRPCKVPYGYRIYRGRVVTTSSEAEFVKKAYELYATGMFSIKSLAEELYLQGFRYTQQPDGKIPRASLASMLKNLFYTGYYTFPEIEDVIKGIHKAIIERSLYDKVQAVLKIPSAEKLQKHEFLYSKLLTLQETGKLMTGDSKKDGRYIYYFANNGKEKHRISEINVTKAVEAYFKEIRLNLIPNRIVKEVLKEELKPLKQEYSTLKRNVSRKYHRELRLEEFVRNNQADDLEFYLSETEDIEKTYSDLSERIKIIDKKMQDLLAKSKNVLQKRLYDQYILLDQSAQRQILELVMNKLELQGKKVKLTFKSAFRKIRKR